MSLRNLLPWPSFDEPAVPAARREQVSLLNRWLAAARRRKQGPARDRTKVTVVTNLLSRGSPRVEVRDV